MDSRNNTNMTSEFPGCLRVLHGKSIQILEFEIKIEQKDLKTVKKAKTKQKIIEGRLVEYNKEFTIININGRMKTIRNDTIISITVLFIIIETRNIHNNNDNNTYYA